MVSRTRALRFLRHPPARNQAAKKGGGQRRGLLRLLPVCLARAVRSVADAADAQSHVRGAGAGRKPAAPGEPARAGTAPAAANFRRVSLGGAHGAEYAADEGRAERLLAD